MCVCVRVRTIRYLVTESVRASDVCQQPRSCCQPMGLIGRRGPELELGVNAATTGCDILGSDRGRRATDEIRTYSSPPTAATLQTSLRSASRTCEKATGKHPPLCLSRRIGSRVT